jgi:hypothetical protein
MQLDSQSVFACVHQLSAPNRDAILARVLFWHFFGAANDAPTAFNQLIGEIFTRERNG